MGLLVYGANGYTGRLVAERARREGLRPVLAGRDRARLQALARPDDLPVAVAAVDDPRALAEALSGIEVVLNCAGPFAETAEPLAAACLRAGAHYLDVTGELTVFAALRQADAEARRAGCMLLPGVGFDVVPTDALAAALAERLPGAARLHLAFLALGGLSRGSLRTMWRALLEGGAACRAGRIVRRPLGALVRDVDFGRGPRRCVALPFGDLLTAHHATGIAEITCWGPLPRGLRWPLRLAALGAPLLATGPVERFVERAIARRPDGPDADERARGRAFAWGRIEHADGRALEARLRLPEAYEFTALSAVAAARAALAGRARPGFQTPSTAFGARFVLGLPGVVAEDPFLALGTGAG